MCLCPLRTYIDSSDVYLTNKKRLCCLVKPPLTQIYEIYWVTGLRGFERCFFSQPLLMGQGTLCQPSQRKVMRIAAQPLTGRRWRAKITKALGRFLCTLNINPWIKQIDKMMSRFDGRLHPVWITKAYVNDSMICSTPVHSTNALCRGSYSL